MRYGPGHKARSRAKILEAAGRVFRRRGYHEAGVDEVMQEAGLTAGGFYSHFESKEALLGETLTHIAAEIESSSRAQLAAYSDREWLIAFINRYLSPAHRSNIEGGCPLAVLMSEIARSGDPIKERFEAILRGLASTLSTQAGDDQGDDRGLAILALCIGGLGIARSVRDEALGDRILAACRDLAKRSCGPTGTTVRPE